jgi:hypothetical protein
MTALKSLTFTTLPKAGANPVLNRRTTILARFEEWPAPGSVDSILS